MKCLRYVLAMSMMCALGGMVQAHAFQLGVLDSGPGVDYTGAPLALTFGSCGAGSTSSCVTIENETGQLLTSFQLTFSTANLLSGSQMFSSSDCSTGAFFSSCSVTSLGNNNYSLVFSGGTGVPSDTSPDSSMESAEGTLEDSNESSSAALNEQEMDTVPYTFTIQGSGLTTQQFNSLDASISQTPEPSSIWLMSTGALLLGGFFVYSRRRNGIGEAGL